MTEAIEMSSLEKKQSKDKDIMAAGLALEIGKHYFSFFIYWNLPCGLVPCISG